MRIWDLFKSSGKTLSVLGVAAALLVAPVAQAAEPLRIGYSDWPGWVAWQGPNPVAITRFQAPVPAADDLCRSATIEAVRGFENNAAAGF